MREEKDITHKKYIEVHLYLKAMEKARIQFEGSNDPVDLKIYRTLEDGLEMELEKIYLPKIPGKEKTLKEEFDEIRLEVIAKKKMQIKEAEKQMNAQSREQMSSTVSS